MKKLMLLILALLTLSGCDLFTKTVYIAPEGLDVSLTEVHNAITNLVDENDLGCVAVVVEYYGSSSSSGSGVVFDSDDMYYYIFTNMHVLLSKTGVSEFSIKKISILASSGKATASTSFHYSPENDIAIVKVLKTSLELKVLTMGDARVQKRGSFVVSVGSPLGTTFFNSISLGVLSSTNRNVDISLSDFTSKKSDTVIQHDGLLNPGNSGGALFNINGEVIGINQSKAVHNNEVVYGVSFAIRIEVALDWAASINYKSKSL